MDASEPAHTPNQRMSRAERTLAIFLTSAVVILLGATLYWVAHQVAEAGRTASDVMPDYRRCRDMAELAAETSEEIERLQRSMAELKNANHQMPRSTWPEYDHQQYDRIWKEHDNLAKRYNVTAMEYFEIMKKHDMRFSSPERLPPDALEPLPYWIPYVYRPRFDE